MQPLHQPIKRSSQLAALSREHHEGLLFVWKIKQGIAFGVPAEKLGQYCGWFWQNILQHHFQKEEETLTSLFPPSDSLMNTMIEDHRAIAEKMTQVIDDASYDSLQRLAQIIYHHIRFEERTLFDHIERDARPESLQKAGTLLKAPPTPVNAWTDEFWLRKSHNSPSRPLSVS